MMELQNNQFFCEECNKNYNIPKNLVEKINKEQITTEEAIKRAKERHDKKSHSLITAIKFKIFPKSKEDEKELDEYFDEYAKAVTFAASIANRIRSPFKFCGLSVDWVRKLKDKYKNNEIEQIVERYGFDSEQLDKAIDIISNNKKDKYAYKTDRCNFCEGKKEIYYIDIKNSRKICNSCYQNEFGESGIRKKLVPVKNRKVSPNFNIYNSTKKLAKTHYHYAVRDAIQLLEANKQQKVQRIKRFLRDKRRLKEFEEMLNPDKRIELPLIGKQRVKRYIHISQKNRINELRGYKIKQIQDKIKILTRNIERESRSLRKKSPIKFKGTRIRLTPSIRFDVQNNTLKLTLKKSKIYNFAGTNVANPHGKKYFEEKLKAIMNQKPKYAYVIRKVKKEYSKLSKQKIEDLEKEGKQVYDYYLQYTIETVPKIKKDFDGVIGIDRGIKPNLACLVALTKNSPKPSLVKFFKGRDLVALKIKRRKQLYFLKGKHNKRRKQKRIRPIEPKIRQILHTRAKEIVSLAKEKNFAIVLEKLEKIKKSKFKQRKTEKYRFSLFNFKTLSTFIEYKAKREGIKVIYVPPEMTSQICSHCALEDKIHTNTLRPYRKPNAKRPSYSLFKCKECGIELNADYNAAFNIAQKGLKTLES